MKNIRDEVKNLFENEDKKSDDKKDNEDLELLLDDEQLREGDSSVEEDNLFDKCQKSCDDSYEKCDASCEGNVECENDCMDVYNQCGANCEDLDNIDEAVDKALKEQSSDYDTIPIDDVRKEAIRSIKNMYNHTNEWSVRDTLIKFTEWGFYKGHSMVSIDEKIAKDICKQLIRFLENEARKKDIWDVYDIVSHYASDEQRSEWSEEALREQSDDYDDKILFWVNSEKLDELLHKHFSPGYEGDYYVLSDLDWQKFQDVASSNGFDQEEDYDEAYDLSGKLTQHGKFIREAKDTTLEPVFAGPHINVSETKRKGFGIGFSVAEKLYIDETEDWDDFLKRCVADQKIDSTKTNKYIFSGFVSGVKEYYDGRVKEMEYGEPPYGVEDDLDEAVDKALKEAKDPKAPRVMNIKWKRGGVLGPRASKIPEDVFKEFIDQGRDDSVILSWLSRKFRGIPVSFEWTTFKGSPIKEQRDEYGSVVFVIWDTDHVDFSRTENVGEVPPNKVPLPKDVYLEIEKQALDNWGENPETIEDEQASEDFINEKIKSWLEYEYHWIVKKWSWVPFKIKEHKEKISDDEKWKAPSGRTIDRKVTIRLLNMPQHSIISQADQDALGISRRDHETVRDALRRAEFEDTVKEWKETGEPDINDVDDEETRTREDDDSKMEHDEEPTEISKEEFDQKAKSGKQIGRASERGHILTPRGDVVFHDGPTFLTNDRELVFYDDWSKKYYKIENFGDNLEELERKTDEYYEKEKEKRGFEDDEYYDDVAPHPEERREKKMNKKLKNEVKKIFGEQVTHRGRTETALVNGRKITRTRGTYNPQDPTAFTDYDLGDGYKLSDVTWGIELKKNGKRILYTENEKELNAKLSELNLPTIDSIEDAFHEVDEAYAEDPASEYYGFNESKRLKNEVKKIFGEDKKMLKEGLEGHVNQVLDENGINPYDYWWSNGLNVKNEEVAKRIMKILDNSGEFGPTSFDKATGTISFGVHKSFESKDLKTEVKKLFQEDVEVNIPQRGDFAVAELSPQEKQEAIWQFAGECADVIEKMIESNVSIRGVYGYEVPRKAEVMHARLFDFILAEIERA